MRWKASDIGRRASALVRDGIATGLRQAPLAFWRRRFPKSAIGVCYHMISDARPAHLRHYRRLTIAEFEEDLDYLQRSFRFTSYDELERRRRSGAAARDNSVILTFDDGFAPCADIVAPLLRNRGLSAIFFVIADLIDNTTLFHESLAALCIDRLLATPVDEVQTLVRELGIDDRLTPPPHTAADGALRSPLARADFDVSPDPRLAPLLNWLLTLEPADAGPLSRLSARLGVDPQAYLREVQPYMTSGQIRALRRDGFAIGAHSRSHRLLQGLSRQDAAREIVESCRIVCDLAGQSAAPFAFPYTGGGLSRSWLDELRRSHPFIGLFFDTDGLREDEDFVVQRVFGERLGRDLTLDAILRRAWARRNAWRRA